MVLGVAPGPQGVAAGIVAVESWRPDPAHADDWPDPRHLIRWVERAQGDSAGMVSRVAEVAEDAERFGSVTIVLVADGVGRPLVDMLRARTSAAVKVVSFRSGEHDPPPEFRVRRVPAVDVASSLELVLKSGRMTYEPKCPGQDLLKADLAGEVPEVIPAERALALAAGLAVWWAERPRSGAAHLGRWQRRLLVEQGLLAPVAFESLRRPGSPQPG